MSTLPIVLAHGIFRFDQLRIDLRNRLGIDVGPHYFNGILRHLTEHGFRVRETDANFAGSLIQRSRDLKKQVMAFLSEAGAQKVHIIAHSMGGLDARRMIVDEGMADHVASVTTIGTPHHGTKLADHALDAGGHKVIGALAPLIDLAGFDDLRTDRCHAFNQHARDAEATNPVRYRVVSAHEDFFRTSFPLRLPWTTVYLLQGDNDGVVPRSSQEWDEHLVSSTGVTKHVERLRFPVPADHMNEVGWWDLEEFTLNEDFTPAQYEERVRDFYLQLARTL